MEGRCFRLRVFSCVYLAHITLTIPMRNNEDAFKMVIQLSQLLTTTIWHGVAS